jgi:hypothetical protein
VSAPRRRAAAADRCPVCGEANGCAIAAQSAAPCWCTEASFSAALRDRAARAEGAPRCICARCAGDATPGGLADGTIPPQAR